MKLIEPTTRTAAPGGTWRAHARRAAHALTRPGPWRRGPVPTAVALALGLLLSAHSHLTDRGGVGSLVETFLPWSGVCVPVLLGVALWRRSASAVVAVLLPALVWLHLFGPVFADKSRSGGDLTLVSHNVGAGNADPDGTARALAASGADVLGLEEITPQARGTYERALAREYPHHMVLGTVGVWSRLPLTDTRRVDTEQDVGPLGDAKPASVTLPANRALRTTVTTARGPLTVYVAHLGSVRVTSAAGFDTGSRDRNARALGDAIAEDRGERVVLLGDLNGTVDDRALSPLTSRLRSAQDLAGQGFGFSWPAGLPVARIDQILVRGVRAHDAWLLPETGSDHLPVAARVGW
ncbi:endonuclease/exonuclease/phosphatase family protein [Streptomyces roseirectus]|uniref:Endonuclease/exonuclease/phosphatase family protein n=1 Tax=Streptomyces roseirectus TaxID=2768066 RepID=A0A7H0IRB0_9ACTN|nr:endonuclease/exonuclease/phosphatase family protein [Streptomyces roseirectus]QNP75326.1 endonuclease/exonuclease/phosphatase family protein [Streptomyces roseirectus]